MKKLQILLLVLVVAGIGYLLYVNNEGFTKNSSIDSDVSKQYSPGGEYYAVEKYIKSEWVTCCGNDEPHEKKIYSVSIFESGTDKLIKEFKGFSYEGYQYDDHYGYTPTIHRWYSDDVLQMYGEGIIDALGVFYDISEDELLTEWEFQDGI